MAPSDLKSCTPTKTHLKAKIYIYNKYFGTSHVFDTKIMRFSKSKEINVGPYGPFPSGNVSQKASQHLTNLGGKIFSRLDFPKTSKANEIIFSPINTNISRNKVISFGKPSSIAVRMAEEF